MHDCNERCTHNATRELLRSLGYELEAPRHDAAAMDKYKAEKLFSDAVHDAASNGALRTCTRSKRLARF